MSSLESRAKAVLAAPSDTYEISDSLDVASLIDHTLLKPEATAAHVRKLCEEAVEYGFASVCTNPVFVPLAAEILNGTPVRVGTVAGFPLGADPISMKEREAEMVVAVGAHEIDMVANIGAIKSRDYDYAFKDIHSVVRACPRRATVKVIIETALLTDEEKVIASLLCRDAGARFVKTSTGFSTGGATAVDVSLMRRAAGDSMGVKAAGGIRTLSHVLSMVRAGATRIGTSTGVQIAKESRAGEQS